MSLFLPAFLIATSIVYVRWVKYRETRRCLKNNWPVPWSY